MNEKINQSQLNKDLFGAFENKIKEFFKNKPGLLAGCLYGGLSLFILALFAIIMAIYGAYPFGDATISSYDMSAQIAPFIEHFFDVIEGRTSLFYSYAIAGGADVFGTLAYCCVSPFTFIFLLFGKGNVYYGTNIVLPLKIICVGISALYYVRRRFPQINPFMQLILALSYAFCGYLFVANTYINWVDLLIYLPFVALGFKKVVEGGSKWQFSIALALMIYACFSIACFSLFLVFPIIILYCVFVLEKSKVKSGLVNAIWGLVLAIALALPILLPALRAFLVSGRKTSIFENINAEFSQMALYKKTSYLFTDGVTMFLTLAYFVKNGLKSRKDKFLALTAVILLIPVIVDESMNLLNFGSYMSYSLRFGFLNGFYFFFVACCFTQEFVGDIKKAGDKKVSLKNNLLFGSIVAILTVVVLVGFVFTFNGFEKEIISKYFASRFAHSEGGLEGTAIIFGCISLIALLGGLFVNYKKISPHVLVALLLILTCGQTAFYSANLVSGNLYTPNNVKEIKVLTDYAKTVETGNYTRIKMNGDYLTSDMPLTLHTHSYSVFSSVIDNRNFIAPNFFSYHGNKKNQMRSYGGKVIGDAILGNKYVINKGDISSTYTYLTKVEGIDGILDENGNKLDSGEYTLYKNKYALPHAYAVDYAKTSISQNGLFKDYDSLLKMLGGEDAGITTIKVKIEEVENNSAGSGVYKVKVPLTVPGDYYISTFFSNESDIKYTTNVFNENEARDLSNSPSVSLGRIYKTYSGNSNYSLYLKSYGEPLTKEQIEESCVAFVVPDAFMIDLYKSVTEQDVEFSTGPKGITVKLNAKKGQYLFLNYVSLPGHEAFVNGVKKPLEDNVLNFMLVELEEGENQVEITYKSPYISLIGIGALIATVIVVAYVLLEKFGKKILNALQPFVFWAGIVLGVLVVGFFLVFPTCVFSYKMVAVAIDKILIIFA